MTNNLLNRIELGEYDKCYLKTYEIIADNNAFVENNMKLSISISDDQEINENWLIKCNGILNYHNLIRISYMPYFKISVEDKHPLLWSYMYDTVECTLNGLNDLKANNLSQLIGELAQSYKEHTYGFVKFETNPILNQIQNKEGEVIFSSNQKIIDITEGIFNKYDIRIENKLTKSGSEKGWANKPNAKVLLFRNPHISSIKTIRGQSYVIATDFDIRIKNET